MQIRMYWELYASMRWDSWIVFRTVIDMIMIQICCVGLLSLADACILLTVLPVIFVASLPECDILLVLDKVKVKSTVLHSKALGVLISLFQALSP